MPRTYTMTAAQVLAEARQMLNDTRVDMGLRDSDDVLLGHLNDALQAAVGVAPGWFTDTVVHTCQAGALQAIEVDRAVAFLDAEGLPESDLMTLDRYAPGWQQSTPASPFEFLRQGGEPLRFFVYPPAPAGASIRVRLVVAPALLTAAAQVVPLPEHTRPALVEYVAGRASLKDDEHVNSQRATVLLDRFVAGVKAMAS
jgi:hypothetical protein